MDCTITIDGLNAKVKDIYMAAELNEDKTYNKILNELNNRTKHKYLPLINTKAKELEADTIHLGFMITGESYKNTVRYGIGFYKENKFLGYIPIEKEFLGSSWYVNGYTTNDITMMPGARFQRTRRYFRNALGTTLDILAVSSEPKFIEDKEESTNFYRGLKLAFKRKQESLDYSDMAPCKIRYQ